MGLRKNGRANTLPYFGTSTVEKSFFEKAHYGSPSARESKDVIRVGR
jgi:hypothetical protein